MKIVEKLRRRGVSTQLKITSTRIIVMILVNLIACSLPNLVEADEVYPSECPFEVAVFIDPVTLSAFSETDQKTNYQNLIQLTLESESPFSAQVRDATSGKVVLDHCKEVEWMLVGVDSKDCALLNHMKLDSAQAPTMLTFESSSPNNTCRDGVYEYKLTAIERKTDSSVEAVVLIEVKNGLISTAESVQVPDKVQNLDNGSNRKLSTENSQSSKADDLWFQTQESSKDATCKKDQDDDLEDAQEKVMSDETYRRLYGWPCPAVTPNNYFLDGQVITLRNPNIFGQFGPIAYTEGITMIDFLGEMQVDFKDVTYQSTLTTEMLQNPDCYDLQWRVTSDQSSFTNIDGYLDNDQAPAFFVVPGNGGFPTVSTANTLYLQLFNYGALVPGTQFWFGFDFIEGTAPFLCLLSATSPDSDTQDYSENVQIAPFIALSDGDPACVVISITCVLLIPTSPDICGQGSFNPITQNWEFATFNPSALGITSFPATIDLEMTVTDDYDSSQFPYQITITDLGCNAPTVCSLAASSPTTDSQDFSNSVQIASFQASSSGNPLCCAITSISCSQTSETSPNICGYGSFNLITLDWEFSTFDPYGQGIIFYPATFTLSMTAQDSFGTAQFPYQVTITDNSCNAPQFCSLSQSDFQDTQDYSENIQLAAFSASIIGDPVCCLITSISCNQVSPASPDICSQGSFNPITLNWEFTTFDPGDLGITSYPATIDLSMTANDDYGSTQSSLYQVIITDNGCNAEYFCSYFISSPASVPQDYSQNVQIAPYETSASADPSCCYITDISCTQMSPISPDVCSEGSFNPVTKQWEFSTFDPNTLGVVSYPATFDLDMQSFDQFGDVTFTYQITITDVNGCQDLSLQTIQAPQDVTVDYIVGQGDLSIDDPPFTAATIICSGVSNVSLVSDNSQILTIDQAGTFNINTNDATLAGTTSLVVFQASLTNYPLITATANIFINIQANTDEGLSSDSDSDNIEEVSNEEKAFQAHITNDLNKMPDPFFSEIGSQINQPFQFESNSEDDGIEEINLGELIVRNDRGEIQVTLAQNEDAPFIELIVAQNQYKLRVNKNTSKPGNFEIKMLITGKDRSLKKQQSITIPVFIVQKYFIIEEKGFEVIDREEKQSSEVKTSLPKDKQIFNNSIPKPRLQPRKISLTGYLELEFSTLRLVEASQVDKSNKRQLQSEETEDLELDQPTRVYGTANKDWNIQGLTLWIEPSEMQDAKKLQFQYQSGKFTNETLGIQLKFEDPDYVSQIPSDQEQLVMSLERFRDIDGYLITDYHVIRFPLPNQIDKESATYEGIRTAAKVIVAATGVTFGFTFILSQLMSLSLNKLLAIMKNMQIISHLPLLAVFVPATTQTFLEPIFRALRFDYFDLSKFIEGMFHINNQNDQAQLDDKFVQLGYASAYMPVNLGTLLFILLAQISITIILLVISFSKCLNKCKLWARNKIDGIFFNSVLKTMDGLFLLILMTIAINIQKVVQGKIDANSTFYISIIGLIICLSETICIVGYLKVYQSQLNEKRRIKRCGYIYEGLSYVKKSYKALALPVIIQLRLILLIYVILYLGDNMVVQVLLFSLSSIFIIFLVGTVHPFDEYRQNYYEIASESVIIFTLDLLLFSSDPSTESKNKKRIGIAIICIIGLSILCSVGKLLQTSFHSAKLYVKRWQARRQGNGQIRATVKTKQEDGLQNDNQSSTVASRKRIVIEDKQDQSQSESSQQVQEESHNIHQQQDLSQGNILLRSEAKQNNDEQSDLELQTSQQKQNKILLETDLVLAQQYQKILIEMGNTDFSDSESKSQAAIEEQKARQYQKILIEMGKTDFSDSESKSLAAIEEQKENPFLIEEEVKQISAQLGWELIDEAEQNYDEEQEPKKLESNMYSCFNCRFLRAQCASCSVEFSQNGGIDMMIKNQASPGDFLDQIMREPARK